MNSIKNLNDRLKNLRWVIYDATRNVAYRTTWDVLDYTTWDPVYQATVNERTLTSVSLSLHFSMGDFLNEL